MNLTEKAKIFATKAHDGQTRKLTGKPMIGHPIRVAETLRKAGFSEEVIAAGYLHDTVEDTPVTMEEIKREFGERVAEVVAGNTENKAHSWHDRKQHTIEAIKTAPLEVKALVVADKLDNLRSLAEDINDAGEGIWAKFKKGRDEQKWYFTGVAKHMRDGLDTEEIPAFFDEYEQLVHTFFNQ
ncbi:HD domain-containing protein [Gracilibacillus sp. Marseille-QA3620]